MICQNCGKNEANIKYTQIINGVKKQMNLCSKCAEELGIEDMGFDMPINFSSFLSDMFDEYEKNYFPEIINPNNTFCDGCNMTYEEFLNTGKFGCEKCYENFEAKIRPLLKSIQGSEKHIGKISKNINCISKNIKKQDEQLEIKQESNKASKENNIEELKERLKIEIKEERYEDAAKTRDEIKKLEDN